MRSRKDFIKDGLMLTLTALILRSAGVFFTARLSITAGSAVMGLYTQIMTVYAFAVTAAAAGVNLGAVRIVSECCGSGESDRLPSALSACVHYCLRAGILVCAIMFFGAPFFGGVILGDTRTVASLRALALALPFISLSNAYHGYFNGVKKISRSAFTSLLEQFIRITFTLVALSFFSGADTETLCLVLVLCNALSEALSFLILFIFYQIDKSLYNSKAKTDRRLYRRFLKITLPIAASSLVRSALTTTEHILIPIGLKSSGLDAESALSQYGIVSGMVLPILLYPMALLTSFASITIAELSARISASESKESIQGTVTRGLSFAIVYGIGAASIIGFFSADLGFAIYKSAEAGEFIKILAPLIFFMYLDHIADGMLKGLDKQNYVMWVNIFDASMSVLFAVILIPKFGIYGFVASLYLCECLNCFFSFGRLFLMISPNIKFFGSFIIPISCAMISIHALNYVRSGLLPSFPFPLLMFFTIGIYFLLLYLCGSLSVFFGKSQELCASA